MPLPKDFTFTSFVAPGLIIVGNETFTCPGWHKVPNDTSLEELYKHWTKYVPKESPKKSLVKIIEMVDSSTASKQYKVIYDGMWWHCGCAGFGFRRKCRHVDLVKQKHNIK